MHKPTPCRAIYVAGVVSAEVYVCLTGVASAEVYVYDIPLVEYDEYVAYNNERGGVIETLKEDGIVDLDSTLSSYSVPEWLSAKAMVSSWLVDAALYELWVGSDGSAADKIYFSDLPWPLGKLLHFKQSQAVKLRLGITKDNAEEREAEIFKKANLAYEALSLKLGDQKFLFGNRPTSVDAIFLGHALFVLHNLAFDIPGPSNEYLKSKIQERGQIDKDVAHRVKVGSKKGIEL
ncbi:hypothetical protein ACLOJK_003928 [Asimina triloba]